MCDNERQELLKQILSVRYEMEVCPTEKLAQFKDEFDFLITQAVELTGKSEFAVREAVRFEFKKYAAARSREGPKWITISPERRGDAR